MPLRNLMRPEIPTTLPDRLADDARICSEPMPVKCVAVARRQNPMILYSAYQVSACLVYPHVLANRTESTDRPILPARLRSQGLKATGNKILV